MAKAYKDVCPCKGCNLRTITCHSVCKEYKQWKKEGIEIKKRPFFETRKKGKNK